MSDIVLTAGVRQNLLSLQDTAALIGTVQNRLATGKRVNTALDNPTNYFTSQALNNRASDLNALLDSIGQAQKTLEAADKGLTSLTNLVQSARSIAKQARQTASPTSNTYGQITLTGTSQAESLGTTGNGAAIAVGNTTLYSFTININGTGAVTVDYTSDANATYAEILAGLQADFTTEVAAKGFTAGTDLQLVANAGGDGIKVNAQQADIDFVIGAGAGNSGLVANTYNSTSLLDRVVAGGGVAGTSTLQVAVNGGATSTITFGTAAGQVSTQAELNTALTNIQNLTASVSGTVSSFVVGSSSSQNSLSLTGSDAGLTTAIGFSNGTSNGVLLSTTGTDPTRASLQADYNNILTQIDQLAKDSSYNGINLLFGDDLKVIFNEKGTSSLTIAGVTFDSAGLQLSAVGGTGFQSNSIVDATIGSLDTALTTLRTQAAKFGSNLTTVQTRQDFTKNLVNTLQTGADSLVLADTNEEGANLLALQTRQQLSTTALS